ncbi:MAG: acyltransferase [Acidimicrobiales bacterium]
MRVPRERRTPPASSFARWGTCSFLVAPTRISGTAAIEIGDGVVILEDSGLAVDTLSGARLVVGDHVHLAPGAEIVCSAGVTIETGVSSSDYVAITDTWGPLGRDATPPPPPGGAIVIEAGAYLGWGCVIGPGVRVGAGAFVGEGAVVLDDVAAHSVVYGNPATVVRRLDTNTMQWEGTRFP